MRPDFTLERVIRDIYREADQKPKLKMNETKLLKDKRAKFVELANKRVQNALKAIRLIGNLANARNYDYTREDMKQIFGVLTDELNGVMKRFQPDKESEKGFSLKP
jgi:hypothetical protein